MQANRPIVTLTTDFQTADSYVAAMKGVLLRHCRNAILIDVTHQVPRHDVVAGSIVLERALASFPPGTFHLAVVDPGVGTDRQILLAEVAGQTVICPDNGLITWPKARLSLTQTWVVTWRPEKPSSTFHGRDVMAPAIGMLLQGHPIDEIAEPIANPVLIDLHVSKSWNQGTIIHIDAFGNATTNLRESMLVDHRDVVVTVGNRSIGMIRNTYGDVQPGQPLALIGSSGLLEIAVREGSAAELLKLKVGDVVSLH